MISKFHKNFYSNWSSLWRVARQISANFMQYFLTYEYEIQHHIIHSYDRRLFIALMVLRGRGTWRISNYSDSLGQGKVVKNDKNTDDAPKNWCGRVGLGQNNLKGGKLRESQVRKIFFTRPISILHSIFILD